MARQFTASNTERFRVTGIAVTAVPVTMACWFYPTNAGGNDYCMMQLTDASQSGQYFRLGLAGGDGLGLEPMASVSGAGQFRAAIASAESTLNNWHHACGTWTSTTDRNAFLDGGNKTTNTTAGNLPTGLDVTDIGYEGDTSPGDPWDGRLADCAIWNVELTDAEVAILALGFSPLQVRPDALQFFAPLNQVSGDERDIIGGLTLADVNSVTDADGPPLRRPTAQILQFPPAAAAPAGNPHYYYAQQ